MAERELTKFGEYGADDTMLARVARKLLQKYYLATLSTLSDGENTAEIGDDGRLKVDTGSVQIEGGSIEAKVSDDNQQELLNEILKQMKIMNLHLALMTDTQIRKQEVE